MTAVAASAGAACHADQVDVSHVLTAMHVPIEYAMGTIRFSVGRSSTVEEIEQALVEITRVIHSLRPEEKEQIPIMESSEIRLTQFTHGLGCACKMRPQLLEQVLQDMPLPHDKRILVGTETADDAAVFLISENQALVQTVDFFTPIVDDPYQFGAISAANSLSDIYAMGAQPLFALSIVAFPSNRLPITVLRDILRGAYDKTAEAGIAIVGGHTIDDPEPKFGLAVTGSIHPDKILTNASAKPGDVLVLTKSIGTGIISTALKQGSIDQKGAAEALQSMAELNRASAEAMISVSANACTDVTGFGLLGHLLGMMKASGTSAVIHADAVPLLKNANDLAVSGVIPGGTKNNLDFTLPHVKYAKSVSNVMRFLLNDAQTSGGLLISLPQKDADEFVQLMKLNHHAAVIIGEVKEKQDKFISVT
jgi:cysteine desulfurase